MRKSLLYFLLLVPACLAAQPQIDLSYYMPEGVKFDPAIPTPQSVIGHQVGEWHVSHDRLVSYMQALDRASDRVTLEVTGHTYEGRPLLLLTITSPKNHQNLESIRQQHLQLSDPARSSSLDVKTMPAVFYLGCSIHGNEASGANAGLLSAYYFAAAQGPEIEKYLDNTIILFDPSFNPDGLQRFSSWVNSRKSMSISPDANDTEHNEPWPGGRTNHYWFDLNRDWMVAQLPESQARIKKFQQWKPNLLTDHHEQGTNATFFFMPGVPTRVHPLTPPKNQELTRKLGEFHAKALDQIGSLYFTQEGYDDFYYGKGSTYPDTQGSVGILFEQASSRGHAQESVNGVLRFPFAIRNHFTTMLSSLKAINELREEFLNYQRDFYKTALTDASKDPVKSYIVGASKDRARTFHFGEMMLRQNVEFYKLPSAQTINGKTYEPDAAFVVPANQANYRLVKAMFEKRTKFDDSLFYDISSWTLPLAFGLDYEEMKAVAATGERITELKMPTGRTVGDKAAYAYAFESYGYYAPRAMYRLLSHGIRIKVSNDIFNHASGKRFERGTILVPLENQEMSPEQVSVYIKEIVERDGIDVYGYDTGLDYKGVSLGSSSFTALQKPVIAMIIDNGVSANDAGEIWHLLDTRFNIPVTLIQQSVFNTGNISKYNVIIFPPGTFTGINDNGKEKLKAWTQSGGVVIGFETALTWLTTAGIGKFEFKKDEPAKDPAKAKPYADIQENTGAQETSGAIFQAEADLTNPLLFGYWDPKIPVFKGNNIFMEKGKGAYSNPLVYGSNPLLSGYISKPNYDKMKNTSIIGVSSLGRGKVIGFTEGVTFRAFWYGTAKMLMNAVYYGGTLNNEVNR
ncbi:MAG TPA: M14 metallopeptidase family protein [Cyclobacteriaceae bacterium]|nr:M14 metallopeptidase family protein [Cyclobacteriaceae bacterium]